MTRLPLPATLPLRCIPATMRATAALTLLGERCVLVPSLARHVPTYHAWMQDAALLEATASEPLSLAEEHAMCASWREDADKCTFIILDRAAAHDAAAPGDEAMVGDVNLFLNDADDAATAEIEVMVAVQGARRRGVAQEALQLLQAWAAGALRLRRFRAKIGQDNAPSLALFRRLGYAHVSSSAVFEEASAAQAQRMPQRTLPQCCCLLTQRCARAGYAGAVGAGGGRDGSVRVAALRHAGAGERMTCLRLLSYSFLTAHARDVFAGAWPCYSTLHARGLLRCVLLLAAQRIARAAFLAACFSACFAWLPLADKRATTLPHA